MKLRRFCAFLLAGALVLALSSCGTGNAGAAAALTKQSFVNQVTSATALPVSVHLNATVSGHGLGVSVNGDVAVNGKTLNDLIARLRANVLVPRGSATLLVTHGAAYVKTTGLPVPTQGSKPWLKVDLTGPHSSIAETYNAVLSRLDPQSVVKAFRATTQVRRVGDATINGVATTHYVVTVDTAKVLQVLGSNDMAGSRVDHMRGELPKTFDYDVWLDSSHRPVRIRGTYAGMTVDVTFSSWGESVSVNPPPARLTTSISL